MNQLTKREMDVEVSSNYDSSFLSVHPRYSIKFKANQKSCLVLLALMGLYYWIIDYNGF